MSNFLLELKQRYEKSLIDNQKVITERNYYFSYTCGLSVELINQIGPKLNPNTYQLLFLICTKLKFSNQTIDEETLLHRLKFQIDYAGELEWSRTTFYRAMKPLIENGVVIKMDKKYNYLVNPFYFNILSAKQYELFKHEIFKIK